MRAVFISYRREDVEGHAGRLFQDLASHFGRDAVFMDVAGIEPGRDFRKVIDRQVASCGVLLALIGKRWLDARNEAGLRRLDDPADFVRLETAAALKRDIPVVPVLVHGGRMPRAEDLPDDLKDLAYRNAVELSHARWQSDVGLLVKALGPYVEAREKGGGAADVTSQRDAPPRGPGTDGPVSGAPSAGSVLATPVPPSAQARWRPVLFAGIAAVVVAVGGYVAYDNFSAQRGAAEKARAEASLAKAEAAAAKAAAESAAADRIAAERAAAEKVAADRAAAERAVAEKAASDRAVADRAAAEKAVADRAAAAKAAADSAAARKAAAAKDAADKADSQKAAAQKAAAEKAAVQKAVAAKAVADKAAADSGVDSPQARAARAASMSADVDRAVQTYSTKSHSVTLVGLDPPSNSTLRKNQAVRVSFSYATTAPGGVRIFVRPMIGLSAVTDYFADTSPLLPAGSGAGDGTFRVRSGPLTVDGIEIRMTSDAQKDALFRSVVPVRYVVEGEAEGPTSAQLKMKLCNEQARDLKGDERKRFMTNCLRY